MRPAGFIFALAAASAGVALAQSAPAPNQPAPNPAQAAPIPAPVTVPPGPMSSAANRSMRRRSPSLRFARWWKLPSAILDRSGLLVTAEGLALPLPRGLPIRVRAFDVPLKYAAPYGPRGPLKLQAIDVVNEVAVVQLDKPVASFFEFEPRALAGTLPKGERLFAMGNPLDLGFTIVEGTYNGLVDYSYNERSISRAPSIPA